MKPSKIYSLKQNALGVTIVHSTGTFFFKLDEILSLEYRNSFFSKIKTDGLFWLLTVCLSFGWIGILFYDLPDDLSNNLWHYFLLTSALMSCFSYLIVRTLYFFCRRDYFVKDVILITLLNNQSLFLIDSKKNISIKTLKSNYDSGIKLYRVKQLFADLSIEGKEFEYGENIFLEWIWLLSIVVIILAVKNNWSWDYFIFDKGSDSNLNDFTIGFIFPLFILSMFVGAGLLLLYMIYILFLPYVIISFGLRMIFKRNLFFSIKNRTLRELSSIFLGIILTAISWIISLYFHDFWLPAIYNYSIVGELVRKSAELGVDLWVAYVNKLLLVYPLIGVLSFYALRLIMNKIDNRSNFFSKSEIYLNRISNVSERKLTYGIDFIPNFLILVILGHFKAKKKEK